MAGVAMAQTTHAPIAARKWTYHLPEEHHKNTKEGMVQNTNPLATIIEQDDDDGKFADTAKCQSKKQIGATARSHAVTLRIARCVVFIRLGPGYVVS